MLLSFYYNSSDKICRKLTCRVSTEDRGTAKMPLTESDREKMCPMNGISSRMNQGEALGIGNGMLPEGDDDFRRASSARCHAASHCCHAEVRGIHAKASMKRSLLRREDKKEREDVPLKALTTAETQIADNLSLLKSCRSR